MSIRAFLFALLTVVSIPSQAVTTPRNIPSQTDWLRAMHHGQSLDLATKIMRARILFSNIAWNAEASQQSRWSTPPELLTKGYGNLLDLVTAYYFTLRGMGVSANDLRLFFGQIRTLDQPVPHLLLAVRTPNRSVYFIDPIKDIPMSGDPPSEFRPTMALNETGSWWTPALTDLSVWNSLGSDLVRVEGWSDVRDQTLDYLGLTPKPVADPIVAAIENDPPAAGVKKKTRAKAKKSKKTTFKTKTK